MTRGPCSVYDMATTTARTTVRAQTTPVRHEGAGGRITRIGYAAKITFADGSVEVCKHSHRTREAARPCADRIVKAG